jgi:uncharacterized membrane protein YcaP (DUF421 family)
MDILYLVLRTILTFFVLLLLARLLGNKQLGHLTFFNYITGITIGSITANIISNENGPYLDEFLGLIIWCVLTAAVGYVGLKSGDLRLLLDGQPIIVIKKGKLVRSAMQKARLNMDDLTMLLREQKVFSLADAEYAILETNGILSVLQKPNKQQITKEEMKITPPVSYYLPSEIIVDGKVILKNLKEFNLDIAWLRAQLQKQNIQSPQDVFYAELQADGSLYLERK